MPSSPKLAILVSGGPAPGINAVIGAAAIQALNHGFSVIGIYDGFKWLSTDRFVPERHTVALDFTDVARIHFTGGSILRLSRTALLDEKSVKPPIHVLPDPAKVRNVIRNFTDVGVTHLITIGGDDTALSARFVADETAGRLRLVHVPKTIDNDLPLPGDIPTFGYNTARHLGSELIANLMEDAKTTSRWYMAVVMGRHAGFLALGMGKSTSATVTLIPEEFHESTTLSRIADVLEGAMLKRLALMGRPDGVAILAEGLAYRLGDKQELERIMGKEIPLDAAGHLRLAEIPLADMLCAELKRRFAERGEKVTVIPENIGYMLRCAPPTPFDMAYCRDLGHGAARLLMDESIDLSGGVMVTLQGGNLVPMKFADMIDPQTNRTRIRTVNVRSESYQVARSYMIRLEKSDLDNPVTRAKLAAAAKMSEEDFVARFKNAATRLIDLA